MEFTTTLLLPPGDYHFRCETSGGTGWTDGPQVVAELEASYTVNINFGSPPLSCGPPDLATTPNSLAWNNVTSGLTMAYLNKGSPTLSPATAALYWAKGNTTNDILPGVPPIFTTNIPAGFMGRVTNDISESYLNLPPTNATRLLLVLDPDNLTFESTKTNNVAVLTNTFRHVILVMMENRSFDHLLGWLPGSDGRQIWTYTDDSGKSVPTRHLAPNFQGCGCSPPDQTFGAPLVYNKGRWDGWLTASPKDTYSIGYYTADDLPFFGKVAPEWTVCDHYHAALLAETQPNRIYQHSAQTDTLRNRSIGQLVKGEFVDLETIWDRLIAKNIRARYYYSPLLQLFGVDAGSVLSLWHRSYSDISSEVGEFFLDCSKGTLPAVSFVDPEFTAVIDGLLLGDTTGNDYHPRSDIRNGEAFLARIYNAVISSPNWASTVLIINFDEWGGFFDHLPPRNGGEVPDADKIAYDHEGIKPDNPAYGLLGFRVPCVVISPWSRKGSSQRPLINHQLFSHPSVLKLIENRWQLVALTSRDKNAQDLADVLDFDHPNYTRPELLIDSRFSHVFGGPCESVQLYSEADGRVLINWDATCENWQLITARNPSGPWSLVDVRSAPYSIQPGLLAQFFALIKQ